MNKKYIFAFAVLALVIFALGAQLATAQPVELQIGNTHISFLPLVITTKAAEAPSGVLYVFSSTATTNGDPGGRSAMNDICPSEDPDAHFCHLEEIENAWVTSGVYFDSLLQDSWVEYTADGWESTTYNCGAWTTSGASGMSIFHFAFYHETAPCDSTLFVACCKQMP